VSLTCAETVLASAASTIVRMAGSFMAFSLEIDFCLNDGRQLLKMRATEGGGKGESVSVGVVDTGRLAFVFVWTVLHNL
jgi:hypothetical protein